MRPARAVARDGVLWPRCWMQAQFLVVSKDLVWRAKCDRSPAEGLADISAHGGELSPGVAILPLVGWAFFPPPRT